MKRIWTLIAFLCLILGFQNCGQNRSPESVSTFSENDRVYQTFATSDGIVTMNSKIVSSSSLFSELKGYAKNTTGGLNGQVYVVTRKDDSLTPGTLRYGVESLTGPTWIVFDKVLFPKDQKVAIYLKTSLNLRDNLTIDGRGSYVSIRKKYDWKDATWLETKSGAYECTAVASPSRDMGSIVRIRSKTNIILTHLDFLQVVEGEEPPFEVKDTQCFGDVISIYNLENEQETKFFDKIWINQSTFQRCGDECIAISRTSTLKRATIAISNNLIANSYKGILIGIGQDIPLMSAISVYQNHFAHLKERVPRIQNSIVHFFNNVVDDWEVYGTGVFDNTRVIVENNVFRSGAQPSHPWRKFSSTNAFLWVQGNILKNVSLSPVDEADAGFPKSSDLGGPWYYDSKLSIQSNQWQPGEMGWKMEYNDVSGL